MPLNLFDNIQPDSYIDNHSPIENPQLLTDLFKAYFDARRNKRNSLNQLQFELHYESNLIELYYQILNRTYTIKPSIAFIIRDPVQREIFAADFRDRVVHHLIYNYISPIFERVFINDAYSCRTGKGTSYGIERVQHFIRSCSQNYTRESYILKLDIKGYFMAINKQILFEKVKNTLTKFRCENMAFDFDTVMYLIEKVIFNNPIEGCIIKGKRSDWAGLPASKSLFQSAAGCGLPIGNLTSQLFSNVYLSEFDHYIKCQLQCKYYGRYVDDFVLVSTEKEFLTSAIPQIADFLMTNLQLTLHPKKIYLQQVSKGIKFLGIIIKPHRTYIANRTKGNFYKTIQQWNKIAEKCPDNMLNLAHLQQITASINSYLGCLKHSATYNLRKRLICNNLSPVIWRYVYFADRSKIVIMRKYRTILVSEKITIA